jgi:asparagine synthase (glutamine-hydrolysing)
VAVELPERLNPLGLSPLDLAGGTPWGHTGAVAPRAAGASSPRAALERSLLALLERGPCTVAFSGGRDSSALLALAVHVARREGLEAPRTVTVAFDGAPLSDESEWQRLVLDHLGLPEGERIDGAGGRMDFVGPVARATFSAHGILYPHHAHMYAPLVERAAGTTLVVGFGGDELFDLWRLRGLAGAVRGRRRPRRYDLTQLGLAVAPPAMRRATAARFTSLRAPWLTAAGERAFLAARAGELAAEPAGFGARMRWWPGRRGVVAAQRSLGLMADAAGTRMSYPLLEPGFLAAVAARYGRLGPGARTVAWRDTFGDLLPAPVVERQSKAPFIDVFWTEASAVCAREWDGSGADGRLVDVDGLRTLWGTPGEGWRAALLMQALWLAREGGAQEG